MYGGVEYGNLIVVFFFGGIECVVGCGDEIVEI